MGFPHPPFKKLKSFSDSIPASIITLRAAGQKLQEKSSKKARNVASQRKIFLGRDKARKAAAPWSLLYPDFKPTTSSGLGRSPLSGVES
jgi:hypothetical protein